MVLGATDRFSCIVSLSKFYSSEDPLFLGDSPSPAFSGRSMSQFPTNELFLVPTDFGAISRPMWCLQSSSCLDGLHRYDFQRAEHHYSVDWPDPLRPPLGHFRNDWTCIRLGCAMGTRGSAFRPLYPPDGCTHRVCQEPSHVQDIYIPFLNTISKNTLHILTQFYNYYKDYYVL